MVLGYNLEELIPDISSCIAGAIGAEATKSCGDGTLFGRLISVRQRSGSEGGRKAGPVKALRAGARRDKDGVFQRVSDPFPFAAFLDGGEHVFVSGKGSESKLAHEFAIDIVCDGDAIVIAVAVPAAAEPGGLRNPVGEASGKGRLPYGFGSEGGIEKVFHVHLLATSGLGKHNQHGYGSASARYPRQIARRGRNGLKYNFD